ncbi:heparan-alpha-glucosaminide N-acetyltransferase domain-containing protein [uncultured Winogradskyella sp.]|uniref:heparan-alpha-glucosaminide N-acetyltransferase domain-containing protein n=1 Tax=uncultured Winogradskyella sp. TaxID=395353 RepID=UPI003517C9B5
MKSQRLYFIDAVRAFAILMMLQGHFIDSLLDPAYRDSNKVFYSIWEYFRGITAPTFFTISGLIFSYLLIKAKHKGQTVLRIRKGFVRGLMLIGIGYALRIPIFEWFLGEFRTYFMVVDVLQCIGLSLILVILIYALTFRKTLVFSIIMLLLGLIIFTTEPLYRTLKLEHIPLFFSNYLSKANGSIFTIIPWFGYVCFGAFVATIFYRYLERHRFKSITVTAFTLVGLLLIQFSSHAFMWLYKQTGMLLFYEVAHFNYLYTRLGNVLILFALFYAFESLVKQPLILKIGQKTLSIYVIHFIIIYGSFTGFGLYQIIGKTLQPSQAIIGALVFLTTVCFIAFYYVKTNAFVYLHLRKLIDKLKS